MALELENVSTVPAVKDYRSNSLWRLTLRRIFRQRNAVSGMVLLSFLILVAIFAPVIAPYPAQPGVDRRRTGQPAFSPLHSSIGLPDGPAAAYYGHGW
jgi:ABC-type antimicrobial peptide transport system permease subunit